MNSSRPQPGLLHHADWSSRYASYVYPAVLQSQAIQPSMNRAANCFDHAVIESFFASLESALVHHSHFSSVVEARANCTKITP